MSDRRILGEHDGAPRKPPDNPPSAPRKPPDNPLGDPSAPRSNPRSAPRRDGRPTLTLKGDEVGPEFRALLNRAARLAGVTQAAYVGRAVTEAAQRDLTGRNNPESAPQGNPPAVVTARLEAQVEALAAKVEAIPALVAQVEALAAAAQRPGLWARLEQVLLAARGKPSK